MSEIDDVLIFAVVGLKQLDQFFASLAQRRPLRSAETEGGGDTGDTAPVLDGGQHGGAIVNVAPQPIGGGEHIGQQVVHLETVEFLQALFSRTGE